MKDRWSQLSMSEKSDLMSLYIRNGISSLEEIKKHYNSFATGGQMDTDESKEDGKKDNPPDLGPNSFAMRQIGDWLATRPMSRLENVDTKIRWRLTPQQQAFKKEYDRLQAEEEERRVQARQQADQKLRDDLSGKNGFWNMVGAGLTRAKGIYNIPEYTERFKKYGDLGETFIQDAKNRLDNIQLQGVSRNFKMIGQHGVEGGASTTPHPIHPTITLSNNNRSSVIREFTTHEANHASHGTTYQPKWMEIHNEKIRPVPKKNREDFTNFDKYLDEMDELVERSKTAVEYAHETRLEGETLDQALDRVFESANRDVYNSEIPSDIRQMVKNYTKDSVLKFWKQFLGGLSIPIGVGISNSQSQSN